MKENVPKGEFYSKTESVDSFLPFKIPFEVLVQLHLVSVSKTE